MFWDQSHDFKNPGMPFLAGKKRLRHATGHQKLENTSFCENVHYLSQVNKFILDLAPNPG